MKNRKKEHSKEQTVIAITREDDRFKAVCLAKKDNQIEMLWAKSSADGFSDWLSFASQNGFLEKTKGSDHKNIVVGFNCLGVSFYRLQVPAVKADEMDRLIRLQTEAKLPVQADQVEISYRLSQVRNGHVTAAVAAAKSENLKQFIDTVKGIAPAEIMLNCEAIVKIWTKFFAQTAEPAVVVSFEKNCTCLCLVEQEGMCNSACLDIGTDDLSNQSASSINAQAANRFVQDIAGVLELFGIIDSAAVPIYIFSRGSVSQQAESSGDSFPVQEVVRLLRTAGLKAETVDFNSPLSSYRLSIDASQLFEYRVPIGQALMYLDGQPRLNLFASMTKADTAFQKKHWLYSLKNSLIAAGVMLAVVVAAFYFCDLLTAGRLNKLTSKMDFQQLDEKRSLAETISRYRPDLLGLINLISSFDPDGVVVTGFDFKKGQPVKISGTAASHDQIYKFQENLAKLKELRDVKLVNATEDAKSKSLTFAMNFNYKNFTKR